MDELTPMCDALDAAGVTDVESWRRLARGLEAGKAALHDVLEIRVAQLRHQRALTNAALDASARND